MDKEKVTIREKEIEVLLTNFSKEHLDEECSELCIKLLKKLGRKREVPFKRGKVEIWASAIIHVIATINYLFDEESEVHTTFDTIVDFFNTKKSTVGSKSKYIRDLFKIDIFDEEFSTNKMFTIGLNHYMVEINGMLVPVTHLKEDLRDEIINTILERRLNLKNSKKEFMADNRFPTIKKPRMPPNLRGKTLQGTESRLMLQAIGHNLYAIENIKNR